MCKQGTGHCPSHFSPSDADMEHERRLALLLCRLPPRMRAVFQWLRRPSARWVRIPTGVLLIVGGMLAILPIFGLWMLPVGLVLLAEDVKPVRRWVGATLIWIEHHRPHWMTPSLGNASLPKSKRVISKLDEFGDG